MRERILVVDDSPTIRKVVRNILEANDFSTDGAANGEEALTKLRNGSAPEQAETTPAFDLVLVDFVMPKMNGYQFCREVRANEKFDRVPLVLMSAKGDKIRGQFVKATGAEDAITKPFDPLALVAVIEGALKRVRQGPAREAPDARADTDENSEHNNATSVEFYSMQQVELSSDPGLRRAQIAQQFVRGLATVVGPTLNELAGLPPDSDARVQQALGRAVTPDKLGSLSALMKLYDVGGQGREVLTGDLSFISLAELLQMLELQKQSGALNIVNTEAEITLYLRNGMLDLALGRGLPPAFRLGRYLVEDGSLSREDLDNFLRHRGGSKRLIGDALVQLELASEAQVGDALKRQTSELVYEAVRMKDGKFSFIADGTCAEATLAQLSLPPGGIVMEGFRRVDEWHRIEGTLDFDEVFYLDPGATERADLSALTEQERRILDAIDGERSVRAIVADAVASTFDVCKIMFQFKNSRLIRAKLK